MEKVVTIPIGPIYTGGPCRGIIHVVERGDTLYELGKRYHIGIGEHYLRHTYVIANIYTYFFIYPSLPMGNNQ